MSRLARTSVLDDWLWIKVVRSGTFSADCIFCEWRATSVCGVLWILARQLDCNTFFLSVCVRSSELQCGVHLSVFSSPRVILVGTVVRAAASFVYKVCIDSAHSASNSDVAAAVWVAGDHPRQPSQRLSVLVGVYQKECCSKLQYISPEED